MSNFRLKTIDKTFRPESKFRAFLLAVISFGLAYGLYKGVIDNYLAEVAAMTQFDRGVSEFFRELPGALMIFILALLYNFSAEKFFKTGTFIAVLGMGMLALAPASKVLVTLCIFIYSLGEHMQLGMRSTLSLVYARENKGGAALGVQTAIYEIGTLAGYLGVIILFWLLSKGTGLFKPIFLLAACIYGLGFLFSLKLTSSTQTDKARSRFYFRKKYFKYYMLELFYGARKQIFFTFGPYVLVLFYKASAMTISLLFAVSAVSCFIASPFIGRIIDKLGYKIVMISDTLILVIVCFFYGFAHHLFAFNIAFIICCLNYILDSVISLASMAANVYVQDISDTNDEVRATISTGLSINHVISILIALFGGWIWQVLGIETLFILSAILGLFNSAYAATIKVKNK
ncbi:MAG: MFS transporter [Synergistaceae bacterium]|nr:MFS transporter [Synergistaceae bacterium]